MARIRKSRRVTRRVGRKRQSCVKACLRKSKRAARFRNRRRTKRAGTRRLPKRREILSGGRRRRSRGGGKPFVGYPYDGANTASWPGSKAAHGTSTCGATTANYYPPSSCGGATGGCSPYPGQTGGGLMRLFPQDLVNFGRSLTGGVTGVVDGWKGVPRVPSSDPTVQNPQGLHTEVALSGMPDVQGIHQAAGQTVASL